MRDRFSPRNTAIVILSLWMFLCTTASAQSVLVRAEANPSVVMVGETSSYSVRFLNTDSIPNLNTPRVDGLDFGSTPSTSSYRQIVNGQVSIETEISWPFRPTRTGTFVIPGRTLEVRGESITIPDVEIRAIPMDEETRSRAYLILELPDPPYYVGQALASRLSLLVRRDLNLASIDFPQCTSEAFQHTEFANSPRRGTIDYNGQRYNALQWEIIITPIKSGPAELQFRQAVGLQVVTRNDRFPRIFNMTSTRTEPVALQTEPIETEIRSLPPIDQEAIFSGAIGDFTVDSSLSATDLSVGEPVTFTLSLSGVGNFERIAPPELPQWEEWRIYPPKVTFTPEGDRDNQGTKSFEYILIPQSTSLEAVPGLTYATFNPASGDYQTTTMEAVPVTVEPSASGTESTSILSAIEEEPVASVPEKILPIRTSPGKLRPTGTPLWQQFSFWIYQLAAAVLLGSLGAWQRRRHRLRTDVRLARRHVGSRQVRKALQEAKAAARDGKAGDFLEAARFALQESISHLSPRPVEARTLVTTDCLNILQGAGLPEQLQATVQSILSTADAYQFAGTVPAPDALIQLDKDLHSAIPELSRAAK